MSKVSSINVNYRDVNGRPGATKLRGFAYVRFPFIVTSAGFEEALHFYAPIIDSLRAEGITPIIVATHQLWGEGRGFDWTRMSADDWNRFTEGYLIALTRVAQRFEGKGIVWQIHNEEDQASEAAVGVPAHVYGNLFRKAYTAIKASDHSARVIVGGIVSGTGAGVRYFRDTGIRLHDGVGVHLYGVGANGLYNQFGTIESQLREWFRVTSDVWITEYGVLDRYDEPVQRVSDYVTAFIRAAVFAGAKCAAYFAWGAQHNAYAVEKDNVIRTTLRDALTLAEISTPTPVERVPLAVGFYRYEYATPLTIRKSPRTDSGILGRVSNGDTVEIVNAWTEDDGTYLWQEVGDGYAATGGGAWRFIRLPDIPVDPMPPRTRETIYGEIEDRLNELRSIDA